MKLERGIGILILGALNACAAIDRLPDEHRVPVPFAGSILDEYCYDAPPIVDNLKLAKEKKSYRVFDVTLNTGVEGSDDESAITFEFYEKGKDEPSPVVLLLPILNGQKDLMRPFAKHFARNGYAAVIVDTVQRKTLLEDLANPERAIRQTVQRHRRVIDWVESRPDLDASRLVVFGASLGGFNALFLAALDGRVSAVAPALVGGSLSDVLVTSSERRIKEAVDKAKAELSFDDKQLREHLNENIETDTLKVALHVHADRVLMVLARFDKAVPYDRQVELHEAMGLPEAITLPTGHVSAALYLFYLRSKLLRFFDRKLAETSEHGTSVIPSNYCERLAAGI